jgi:N-acetylmuramoyl-L-alanine amidase
MRFLAVVAVCLALTSLIGSAASRAPAPVIPKTVVNGRDYQDLAGFARANGLTYAWDGRSRNPRASSKSVRLEFSINQRDIKVNGVVVWLSFPVVLVKGRVYLATTDIRSTMEPLLRPPRNAAGRKVKVVALDPGHGGSQPGHQAGEELEKVHVLLLARKVRSLLRASGVTVVMTRDTDVHVDLDERLAIARRAKADLFVSLHYNGAEASSAARGRGVHEYAWREFDLHQGLAGESEQQSQHPAGLPGPQSDRGRGGDQ